MELKICDKLGNAARWFRISAELTDAEIRQRYGIRGRSYAYVRADDETEWRCIYKPENPV